MGWEGANVIFDSWVHPLMMGLEEHLIGMFRHDFEFVEGHRSHLAEGAPPRQAAAPEPALAAVAGSATAAASATLAPPTVTEGTAVWSADGEAALRKIPFFVRGKVKTNTETFARDHGVASITEEVLYDAKAHYSK